MLAPTLAIMVVIGTNIKKAGIFIKPKLNGKSALRINPEIKKPVAPNKAIMKPIAAALPIAILISYPKYLKIGTFIIAPVIPIGVEIKPEIRPKINFELKLKS